MKIVNCLFPSIFPYFFRQKHRRCCCCFGAWRAGDTEEKRRPRHLSSARATKPKPIISAFQGKKWSTKMRLVGGVSVIVETAFCLALNIKFEKTIKRRSFEYKTVGNVSMSSTTFQHHVRHR
jgi:hypothetical protein